MPDTFEKRLKQIREEYELLVTRKNTPVKTSNGIFNRYEYAVVTAEHAPYFWRYDLSREDNPLLMERFGINAAFNAGAIKFNGKYLLILRMEGNDRKSFFAIAESPNGVDNFRFWDFPITMPGTEKDVNVYDMRLTSHADGWIYGVFCTEHRDENVPDSDQSSAIAQCGIARTRDLIKWDRLADLVTLSPQQRNVVLHPDFVDGKYAFYTRPQDGFVDTGNGGGIGFGVVDDIERSVIEKEIIIDKRVYHTVAELKNGLGPAPIKTEEGWLHLAHGVRNTAAGMRYTLYMFMTDLNDLTKVIYKPAGYFLAPYGEEYIGDVCNITFSNGWIVDDDGRVLIYYASSDSRMHVAESSIEQLVDYVMHTAPDTFYSAGQVNVLKGIIEKNIHYIR